MAFSGTQTTRLGVSGFGRGLYGLFSGKTIVSVVVPDSAGFGFTIPANDGGATMPSRKSEFTIPANDAGFAIP